MTVATRLRGVVTQATASAWLRAVDSHPAWRHRQAAANDEFNPYSSSLRVSAVPGLDLREIAQSVSAGPVGGLCHALLGDDLVCDIDQCWVRRQYAPDRAPAGHAAHAWHQDGALGFDFLGTRGEIPRSALLSMLTCWIALTPCGDDAPGLELVERDFDSLLPLAVLRDAAVHSCHGEGERVRPVLSAGDALVFGGGVLHRTHARPTMQMDRTSIELRLFAAHDIPERLRHDRFLHLTPIPETCR